MGCGGSTTVKKKASEERDMWTSENQEYQEKLEFIALVPLMKQIDMSHHPLIAGACKTTTFKGGDQIITEGDEGDELFFICDGVASVHTKDNDGKINQLANLKSGDYFGENALLHNVTRQATVIAETDIKAFMMSRDEFQQLGLSEKLRFARRNAVGAGCRKNIVAKEPSPKTDKEKELIKKAIQCNLTMSSIGGFDDEKIEDLTSVMWKEHVSSGHELITEGDLNADYFYIVQEGSFEVTSSHVEGELGTDILALKGEGRVVESGGSFGELALLYLMPRRATVKAIEDSIVWVIDRQNFKTILFKASWIHLKEIQGYLDGVLILQSLLNEEKEHLATALVEMQFVRGENIVVQGEIGMIFYILYEGDVQVIKDNEKINELSAEPRLGTAQYFGERALLYNDCREATVQVTSNVAKTLVLDRLDFQMLLGPLKDIISSPERGGARRSSVKANPRHSLEMTPQTRKRIFPQDLKKLGTLGSGAFGSVTAWEDKVSKKCFALKRISKGYVVKAGMEENILNEKMILMMTNSDFIVDLFETYSNDECLYFLLEAALGGELYATYNRKGFHGKEKFARYYTAGIVFAFEHLHKRRILYRDLKPENILLTAEGNVQLSDMGLAKFAIGKTYTACGTPDYLAPEIIHCTGHNQAVDWWTLGILLYELLSGHPPFESGDLAMIYAKVVRGMEVVPFPKACRANARDLISGLLKDKPIERLPMRPGGIDNVKGHSFYEGFNWDAMKENKLKPPYKPSTKQTKDFSNFNGETENKPKHYPYEDPGDDWDSGFATVQGCVVAEGGL